jgi:hypothetical protein
MNKYDPKPVSGSNGAWMSLEKTKTLHFIFDDGRSPCGMILTTAQPTRREGRKPRCKRCAERVR